MSKEAVLDRFLVKTKIDTSTGCLEWTAVTNETQGYGRFRYNNKMWLAHRFAYEAFISEVPDGLNVLHKCDNTRCVAPHHLFVGTQSENMKDCSQKNRLNSANANKTHCPKGHPYNEQNTRIATNGSRQCRVCDRENKRSKQHAKH
jgi:hypothetical protein